MDFSKMSTNNWITGGGTIAALVAMLLPWRSLGAGLSWNAFDLGIAFWLNSLIVIAAGVLAVLYATGAYELSLWKFSGYDLPLLAAVAAGFQILLLFLSETSNTAFGFYLAILAAIAVVVGIVMEIRGDAAPSIAEGGASTF